MMRRLSVSFFGTVIIGLICVHGRKGGSAKGPIGAEREFLLEETIHLQRGGPGHLGDCEIGNYGAIWGVRGEGVRVGQGVSGESGGWCHCAWVFIGRPARVGITGHWRVGAEWGI